MELELIFDSPEEPEHPDNLRQEEGEDELSFAFRVFEAKEKWRKVYGEPPRETPDETYNPDIELISKAEAQAREYLGDAATARATASRLRSLRGNIFRKLDKAFNIGEPFSPEQAAARLNMKISILQNYLVLEAERPGTRIRGEIGGLYSIIDPFAEEIEARINRLK